MLLVIAVAGGSILREGKIAILFAATLWSLDGTIIRPNLYELPALNIVLIEHVFGAILLSPFIYWG